MEEWVDRHGKPLAFLAVIVILVLIFAVVREMKDQMLSSAEYSSFHEDR